MGDHPRPLPNDGQAPSQLEGYPFTFHYSLPSSSGESCIESDPQAKSMMDSSISLTESIYNFPRLFGRTYHAYREGSYAFPNDEPELERQALQDTIFMTVMSNRLYYAPLDNHPPKRVLDIATGAGYWAIAMGDRFPNARVVATDLSPIQPETVPANVEFYVEDSSEPWDYSETFDYIHTKTTGACWESFETQIAQQAFGTLSPGGWLESQELCPVPHCDDGTLKPNSALGLWFRDFLNAAAQARRPLTEASQLRSIYERVGFVDVHERVYKIPLNGWARDAKLKEVGNMMEQNMQMGLSAFSLGLFNRIYGLTPEQIEASNRLTLIYLSFERKAWLTRTVVWLQVSLVGVRRDVSDSSIHAYLPFYVVWGRKPFPGEKRRK